MRNEIEITDEVIEAGLGITEFTIHGRRSCRRTCSPLPILLAVTRCAKGIRSFRNLWFQRMNRPDIPRDPSWRIGELRSELLQAVHLSRGAIR